MTQREQNGSVSSNEEYSSCCSSFNLTSVLLSSANVQVTVQSRGFQSETAIKRYQD